jgi:hypothetical protein
VRELVTQDERRIYLDLVRSIALDLSRAALTPLPSVHLGVATLFGYIAQTDVLDAGELAERELDIGLTLVAERGASNRLMGGLSGIGWMLGHVAGSDAADRVCAAFDDQIERALAVPQWHADFDLIRGLAGYGVYALTRGRRGQRIATRILDHLEHTSERAEVGVRWRTPRALVPEAFQTAFPDGRYDLGLSHGIAGVVAVLARFVAAGIESERSARLLEASVTYLLAAPRPAHGRFAEVQHPDRPEVIGCRMAWCYGDLGVVLALLAAARAMDRGDWEAEALAAARDMATRPFEVTGVIDTAICHGSAGLAHFFHRLRLAYDDELFADAARFWLRKTVELRRPGVGLGGFATGERVDGEVAWSENFSLVGGAPGTALVLLAAATSVEPGWDEMLMFDFASVTGRETRLDVA